MHRYVWACVCSREHDRGQTQTDLQRGQCLLYVRSLLYGELEFVRVCRLTHVFSAHTCSTSLQEQRRTIKKAGNQGLLALLSRGQIFCHKDLLRLSRHRRRETGQVWAKLQRLVAGDSFALGGVPCLKGKMTYFCSFQVTGF